MEIEFLVRSAFLALLAVAAGYDTIMLRIPNLVTAALALLFLAAGARTLGLNGMAWASHLGAGVAVFVLGAGLFRLGIFGGGDIKLLAAAALWTGFWPLPFYLLVVALLGGVVAVFFWSLRKLLPVVLASLPGKPAFKLPVVLVEGAGVPYGIAIAIGLVVTAVQTPLWLGSIHGIFLGYFHH